MFNMPLHSTRVVPISLSSVNYNKELQYGLITDNCTRKSTTQGLDSKETCSFTHFVSRFPISPNV